jgi:hypothetical protein
MAPASFTAGSNDNDVRERILYTDILGNSAWVHLESVRANTCARVIIISDGNCEKQFNHSAQLPPNCQLSITARLLF